MDTLLGDILPRAPFYLEDLRAQVAVGAVPAVPVVVLRQVLEDRPAEFLPGRSGSSLDRLPLEWMGKKLSAQALS
jgi:hypothetical protein